MPDVEATLKERYADYIDAFRRAVDQQSAAPLRPLYHLPVVFATATTVVSIRDEAALDRLFLPLLRDLKAKRYVRSEVPTLTVQPLSPISALVTVEYVRIDADGEAFERARATYMYGRGRDGWRIVAGASHA